MFGVRVFSWKVEGYSNEDVDGGAFSPGSVEAKCTRSTLRQSMLLGCQI